MKRFGMTLEAAMRSSIRLRQLRKSELSTGDQLFVRTANSTYTIRILDERTCLVSGGWFDRKGLSPARTKIVGCTWGGTAINTEVAAACGLCLEFSNRLVTSPIQRILVLPHACEN